MSTPAQPAAPAVDHLLILSGLALQGVRGNQALEQQVTALHAGIATEFQKLRQELAQATARGDYVHG